MTIEETINKMEEQIKEMNLFLSVVNEGTKTVTPQVIKQFLVMILSTITNTKNDFEKLSKSNLEELKSALAIIVKEYEVHFKKLEDKGNSSVDELSKLVQEAKTVLNEVVQQRIKADQDASILLNEIKNETAIDKAEIAKQLQDFKEAIPSPYVLEATKIRDELLSLKGDDRLDISAIKGFEEWANKIAKGKGNNKNNIEYIQGGQGYVKSITAGAGITIVVGPNNDVTISASGGSGSGDVVGPSSSVDNTIPRFDSTTGKVIQSSGVVIDDSDNITAVGLKLTGLTASLILGTDASKNIVSLSASTYPNLTELAYVKGVTSAIQTQLDAKGAGTVTSVTSADANATITNTTSTPVITIVSSPKWATARNLAGNSVDGSANVAFANKFIVQGTTDSGLSGAQFLGSLATGIVKNTTTTGVLSIATAGTDYEIPITFSTGLTRTTNTITVNTTQNISTLSNLTSNGLVTTSGGTGALSITVPGTGVLTALAVNIGSAGAFVTFNGALGTPSSATLTNATGLPISGLVASTSTAIGVGSIELGHASDTTITRVSAGVIAVEGVTIDTISATATLTNKTLTSPILQTAPVLAAASQFKWTIPTADDTCTGVTTNEFNAGYTTSLGDLVYLDSNPKWQKCDANAASTYKGLLGIVQETGITNGNPVKVLLMGWAYHSTAFPTFTIGGEIYMSETAGAVTQTAPTTTDASTRILGFAVHADKMWFNPANNNAIHT